MKNEKTRGRPVVDGPLEQGYLGDEIDLRRYVGVIVRRKKLVLIVFLTVTILAALITLFLPKLYEAKASVRIVPARLSAVLSPTLTSVDLSKITFSRSQAAASAASMRTHQTILKSDVIVRRLVEELNRRGGSKADVTPGELLGQLSVTTSSSGNVLYLTVLSPDPGEAKDIAGLWAEEYSEYSAETVGGEIKDSVDFLQKAHENLVEAEKAVDAFDVNDSFRIMQLELTEDESQLRQHADKANKLAYELEEKRNSLKKVEADIRALTADDLWLGACDIQKLGAEHFADDELEGAQAMLRNRALKVALNMQTAKDNYDNFLDKSGMNLIKQDLVSEKKNLTADKLLLSQIEQFSLATHGNLEARDQWSLTMLKDLGGPVSESLLDSTVWQLLSLAERYNFFEVRRQSLEAEITKREDAVKTLDRDVMSLEQDLSILKANLERAKLVYDYYVKKLRELDLQKHSIESEIDTAESELAYSTQLVEKLDAKIKTLKIAINRRNLELTDLERALAICRNSYDGGAFKVEESRIVRALELGEVKVLSKPSEPVHPVKPRKRTMVSFA